MHRFALACCCVAALAGCARSDRRATTDTAAGRVADSGLATTISLADLTGKWRVVGLNEAGDSVVGYVLDATGDTSRWTITFPNRPPEPVRMIEIDGDSIITETGPFESAIRKGVQVRTHGVARIRGGKLVGTTVARYQTSGPDSVLRINTQGTRMP